MKKLLWRSLLRFLVCLGALFSPGAFAFADTSITANITANTTWSTGGGTYIIENAISIDSGVTLTIDPGVVVKFRSIWTTLTVNGTLGAQGVASSSIYFTSIKDDTVGGDTNGDGSATTPAVGDWRYIDVSSGATATFGYSIVRYSGYNNGYALYNNGGTLSVLNSTVASSTSYGLYHTSGTTNVATSTFSGSGSYGIYGTGTGDIAIHGSDFYNNGTAAASFDLSSTLTLSNSGNTASGTGERGFVVYSSSLGSDQTWQADTVPYIISGSGFSIPAGKTLTINPNAVVKFDTVWSNITVNGTLNATSTSSNNIYFTSIKDDTIGGDTNGDSSATTPAVGDWRYITVGSGATTTLKYVTVRYGGYNSGYGLYNNGGTLGVLNSTVASSTSYGVYHASGVTNIATSTFNGSGSYGVYGTGTGSISLTGSTFYNNTTAAGYFDLSNTLTLSNSGNTATGTGERGLVVYSASLGFNQTWQADGVPYIISGSGLTVSTGKTLTINPGAMVKFDTVWANITVNGTLDAQGVASSSIYFTSIKDDTIGGDTNADNTSTSPAVGDWRYITVGADATTTIKYATVSYGGYNNGYGIYNNGGILSVLNSTVASSTSYGIYHGSGTTNIATSTFNGSGSYGVYGNGTGAFSVSGSNFYNNATAAGSFDLSSTLILSNSGNTATGTGERGFIMYSSSLGSNQTWQADTVPYIISSSGFTISAGKTLTVNPGAVVKFDTVWSNITNNGTLGAQGTASSSISFTSLKDDTINGDTNSDGSATSPAVGDWRYITVGSGATTTLKYVAIRYGGYNNGYGVYNNGGILNVLNSTVASSTSYGLYHAAGTTNIATSTFNGSGSYGVYGSGTGAISISNSNFYNNGTAAGSFDLSSTLSLSNFGNTASGTGERGFVVYSSSLGSDQTWQADTIPYIISGSGVTIPAGKTLTINPNAVVKFDTVWANITVNGTLSASGNSLYPITFTSLKDDTIGGDTNTDGSATSPAAGDWRYITIGSGATTTFAYIIARYGGYNNGYELYNGGGTLTIATSTIAYGSSYGVYHGGGTTNVSQSVIRNNGSAGYYNGTTATTTATNNYWGALSGPHNSLYNPSGAGNDVSNYVSFNPWLGTTTNYVWGGSSADWDITHGYEIRWGGTTKYSTAWNAAIDTWNTKGSVLIAPDDEFHFEDLTISDVSDPDANWTASYSTASSTIRFNTYNMDQSWVTDTAKQHITTHELGHALGLNHSYWENIMYFTTTLQTAFGAQDSADYDYCWVGTVHCF